MTDFNSGINLKEEFPHLNSAPIVEAVIDIRFAPSSAWNEADLKEALAKSLSAYSKIEPLRETKFKFVTTGSDRFVQEDQGCVGLKFTSDNEYYVAQFNRANFVFSRLVPYQDWASFYSEAMRLWNLYDELIKTKEIGRVGVRYINCIEVPLEGAKLSDYYVISPKTIKGDENWPMASFLHKDTLQVPNTPYFVSIIKTTRTLENKAEAKIGLVLDIDVFTQGVTITNKVLPECLEGMRWVKNKIFNSSIVEDRIEEFKK